MADWLVDVSTDPRRYPVVHHRHVNGTLRAERDRTPTVESGHDGRRLEHWTYACACGEVYTWDRRSTEGA
jgi:hypothetical protein